MANRYWVGGTETWHPSLAGTRWATTSGGAGGASVPTSADDVFFDANSGAVNVSTPGLSSIVCKSLDFTGFTGTLTGNSTTLSIHGSLMLVAGMTWSILSTFVLSFRATDAQTITTAGKQLQAVSFDGAGGVWTLLDDFVSLNTFTLTRGHFDANDFDFTALSVSSSNSNTREISMGSGTWTITGTGTIWSFFTATNLTFNKETATVECTYTGASNRTINGGGKEFYRITRTASSTSTGTFIFTAVICYKVNFPDTGIDHQLSINTGSDIKLESNCIIARVGNVNAGVVVTDATFDTDGYDVTATHMASTTAGTRAIYLRDSVINLYSSASARCVSFQNVAGLTFDAGTSTINFLGNPAGTTELQGGGQTFYKVVHNGGGVALRLTDANTFGELEITTGQQLTLTVSTTQTINLLTIPDSISNAITIDSSSAGTQATMSIPSGVYALKGVSFKDIAATGNGVVRAFLSDSNQDLGNNLGIDFGKGLNFYSFI